jgi:hypothetical protein
VVDGPDDKKEESEKSCRLEPMAGDDSLIQSDEEEEVKMIENDFKKKKERIKKSELEELE